MEFRRIDCNNRDFIELVQQLDSDLYARYGDMQKQYNSFNTIESLDTVVVAYDNSNAIGCGCLKKYDEDTAEIKRVFIMPKYRGKGISKVIIKELERWAVEEKYTYSILETGVKQFEAIGLYERMGYKRIDNFGKYIGNSNSICMLKKLSII
jgi:putative acetyltransferase